MPIYAYRCESCGHAKDVLQKVSDPLLTICPACHAEAFKKQVTAAGFQLKGSGWYVTDFRGGNGKPAEKAPDNGSAKSDTAPAKTGDAKSEGAKTESPAAKPAAATAPAAAPAASSSGTGSSTGGSGSAP
jgi:putative FmdB family regulatory protein